MLLENEAVEVSMLADGGMGGIGLLVDWLVERRLDEVKVAEDGTAFVY